MASRSTCNRRLGRSKTQRQRPAVKWENSVTFEGREIKTTESLTRFKLKTLKDNGFAEVVIAVDKKDGKYNPRLSFSQKRSWVPDRSKL